MQSTDFSAADAHPDLAGASDQFRADTDANHEEVLSAEQALLSAFAGVRQSENTQYGIAECPRYQVPRRDAAGRLVTDPHTGAPQIGPMELYVQRVEPERLQKFEREHSKQVRVRRGGRMEWEPELDANAYASAVIYHALVPWCRTLYFDNPKLWGNEPVGTGEEFLRRRLNQGEKRAVLDAIMMLESDDAEDLSGKSGRR